MQQKTITSQVSVLVVKLPGETLEAAFRRQERLSVALWDRLCIGPRATEIVDAAYALGVTDLWIGRN